MNQPEQIPPKVLPEQFVGGNAVKAIFSEYEKISMKNRAAHSRLDG